MSSLIQCGFYGANWVEIATFCSVVIGGAFAWWQWRRSCRVSRAEHLNAIFARYSDKKMTTLFYRLVNNSSYGGEGSDVFYLGNLRFQPIQRAQVCQEKQATQGDQASQGDKCHEEDIRENDIDSMLLLFSQICYEHENGTISKQEFAFFCYQIWRTLAHKQFKQYLMDFAVYCGKYKIGCPYQALIREGINVDRSHYERALCMAGCERRSFLRVLKELLP